MGNWILEVETQCTDLSREAEFNAWYNNVHIPDVLETKGFIKATRYELAIPVEGKGKYLAIYEIQADDLATVMSNHGANMKKKEALGRIINIIKTTSRGIYQQKEIINPIRQNE